MLIFFIYHLILTILEIFLFLPLVIVFSFTKMVGRLGWKVKKNSNTIWFHAASLGEVNALKPLLHKIISKYGAERILLTTMTRTGKAAASNIDNNISVSYLPIDLPFTIRCFFKKINPVLIVIMETEFWPQLLFRAYKNNVPVLLINGRLSEKSRKNYLRSKSFWKFPWQAIKIINAQSDLDAIRFKQLGFDCVQNCGNLKFAISLPDYEPEKLRLKYNFKPDDFVITLGSSRPGEEDILLKVYAIIIDKIPELKLIIAPRHLKRLPEIKTLLQNCDHNIYSQSASKSAANILLIDQMGLLTEFYCLSDLVIVGGSFTDFGGHNPLEPAYYAKPVIMGQYHQSCRDSVSKLLENHAILISSSSKLSHNIIALYNDFNLRNKMGDNARRVLKQNSQSLAGNYSIINKFLRP